MTKKPALDPAKHPWMQTQGLTAIFTAINKAGGKARMVGGAVRDSLLGRTFSEVDLAVTLPPQAVMMALKEADIKAVPTGLDHGTVTAVVDHQGYEITTLRHDVETYGRHAKVAFTDDWQADAARRDFTFNAMYVDQSGNVYDYFDGYDDLKEGRVRFIGDPRDRIREDYLRILRFFRFFAGYGKGNADPQAVEVCRELSPSLVTLSVERVWMEFGKLLKAPDPTPACRLMIENGILGHVLPEATHIDGLAKLIELEKSRHIEPDHIRRLAALLENEEEGTSTRLRLSNREKNRLKDIIRLSATLPEHASQEFMNRLLYTVDAGCVRDGLLLAAAAGKKVELDSLVPVIASWKKPVFPLSGGDIMKLGIPAGPKVGKLLKAVEEWWIANGFRPSKEECFQRLKDSVNQ